MIRSPEDMMTAVAGSMKERTGRSLEEWVAVVMKSGVDPLDQAAVRRWLKGEHPVVLQNTRYAIANASALAAGWQRPPVEQSIDDQYTGARAKWRQLFDRLRAVIEDFGDDVDVQGRGTYIPFVRRRQFAAIAASGTRVDIGLRFENPPASPLLKPAKAPGMATHRVSITDAADISPDLERLLRAAYDQNG